LAAATTSSHFCCALAGENAKAAAPMKSAVVAKMRVHIAVSQSPRLAGSAAFLSSGVTLSARAAEIKTVFASLWRVEALS
jgi:hypothetical protein